MASENDTGLVPSLDGTEWFLKNDVAGLSSVDDIDLIFQALAEPKVGKRRRKKREEQGLPDDEAITALAEAYVDVQSRYWPKLVPLDWKGNQKQIAAMAADFKANFLAEDPFESLQGCSENTACAYVRYSDNNSNCRSLAQQLRLILEKAGTNRHFIAWNHVFADAAITGTTAARRGYSLAKLAVQSSKLKLTEMYFDEVGRASRDMIEALNLGRLMDDRQKRLIGVSDGFDSTAPMSKITFSILAAIQEMFIDQLAHKVHRGMNDAFRRGDNVGLHPPGYRVEKVLDSDGNEVLRASGRAKKKLVVDASQAKVIKAVFAMFSERLKSATKIAAYLNRISFCDSKSWTSHRVLKILRNHHYVGVQIRGKTHQLRDRQTGHVTVVKHPKKQWKVRRLDESLRIITWSEFKKARERLKTISTAFDGKDKSVTKSDVYPNALVRPICGDCGFQMIFGRSGPYGTFTCGHSKTGAQGCKAKGHKSRKIVEDSILAEVVKRIDAPDLVERIVNDANRYLVEYQAGPKPDTADLDKCIAKERRGINRLLNLTESADDDAFDADLVKKKIGEIRRRLGQLLEQKMAIEKANVPPPAPVTPEQVQAELGELRKLLQGDVAYAAIILRKLTGPITIRQEKRKGTRGWDWTACFQMDFAPVLVHLHRSVNCPKSNVWVYLNTRGWTIADKVLAHLHKPGKAEAIATQIAELRKANHDSGKRMSVLAVATALGVARQTVKSAEALTTDSNYKPRKRQMPKKVGNVDISPPSVMLVKKVLVLRDRKLMSFKKIAQKLGISEHRTRVCWDKGHPEKLQEAITRRTCPDRGRYSHLGPEKYEQIKALLLQDLSFSQVARRVDVGISTVGREARRMRAG